jgi:hypothetical protein
MASMASKGKYISEQGRNYICFLWKSTPSSLLVTGAEILLRNAFPFGGHGSHVVRETQIQDSHPEGQH